MKAVNISIVLDKRSKLKNGERPVKLRIYYDGTDKRYPIKNLTKYYSMTEKDFDSTMNKQRSKFQHIKTELNGIEARAIKVAEKINPFSFIQFEQTMFNLIESENLDVLKAFQDYAIKKRKIDKVRTAISYEDAEGSLRKFFEVKGYRNVRFTDLTVELLRKYERWMTEELERKRSKATVGVYMRNLRALFNERIDKDLLPAKLSPFRKGGYIIPATRKTNKALEMSDIEKLYYFDSIEPLLIEARDFWFISYFCNGANMRDILSLKGENLDLIRNEIHFIRKKTIESTRSESEHIKVALTDDLKELITRHGNINASQNDLVFLVLEGITEEAEKVRLLNNFLRKINQHLVTISKMADLKEHISFQVARHSYSNVMLEGGVSMEYIQRSLGHKSIYTTEKYIRGFSSKAVHEAAKMLQIRKDDDNRTVNY